MPTHQITHTTVGARLRTAVWSPTSPVRMTSPKSATEATRIPEMNARLASVIPKNSNRSRFSMG
jgi:hypothetical protein